MQFSTKIPLNDINFTIDYNSKILLLGSCFSENIGNKFKYFKFQTEINPFGIIFNVVSLEKLLNRVVHKLYFTEKDLFYHNDLWHCFEVHSELSHPNKEIFLEQLNEKISTTHDAILELTHCFITLGTSWVYENRTTNNVVANCHKVPQKQFKKVLLSSEQNGVSLKKIVALISSINPKVNFIFTVSPVRHIKDGFFENNVSKGNLFSALHQSFNFNETKVVYFPSYEIVMDELRDYRFYEKDMLHPNQLAIDYVWERFSECCFSTATCQFMKEIDAIQKSLSHRPLNPTTEAHQLFLDKITVKIEKIKTKLSHLQF